MPTYATFLWSFNITSSCVYQLASGSSFYKMYILFRRKIMIDFSGGVICLSIRLCGQKKKICVNFHCTSHLWWWQRQVWCDCDATTVMRERWWKWCVEYQRTSSRYFLLETDFMHHLRRTWWWVDIYDNTGRKSRGKFIQNQTRTSW